MNLQEEIAYPRLGSKLVSRDLVQATFSPRWFWDRFGDGLHTDLFESKVPSWLSERLWEGKCLDISKWAENLPCSAALSRANGPNPPQEEAPVGQIGEDAYFFWFLRQFRSKIPHRHSLSGGWSWTFADLEFLGPTKILALFGSLTLQDKNTSFFLNEFFNKKSRRILSYPFFLVKN